MKEKFEKIKSLFATITKMIGKFFETTLEDGTLLKWEGDLTVGTPVFVVDGENEVPAPEGTHVLVEMDNMSIVLDADGVVIEIIEAVTQSKEENTAEGSEVFSRKAVEHFAEISQVSMWSMNVDQETIEVGTKLTYSYTYGETTDVYTLSAGEYQDANGRRFLVDANGVVQMFLEASPAAPAESSDEQMSAAIEELKATNSNLFAAAKELQSVVELMSAENGKLKEDLSTLTTRFNALASKPSDKSSETQRITREESKFTAQQKRLLDAAKQERK
jgi:FtsZ-binding cell division protein ZapB